MSKSVPDAVAVAPRRFPGLDGQTGLSPRARALLQGVLDRSARHFDGTLAATLAALRERLGARGDRLLSHGEQGELLAMLRAIERFQGGLLDGFISAIVTGLLAPPVAPSADPPGRSGAHGPLQLVAESVLEEDLTAEQIIRTAQVRHGEAMRLLASRLAVVRGRAPYRLDDMPLGAQALLDAWKQASGHAEQPTALRVAGLQEFGRTGLAALDRFYDSLNGWLAGQGILPHLHSATPVLPRRPPSRPDSDAADDAAVPPSDASADRTAAPALATPSPSPSGDGLPAHERDAPPPSSGSPGAAATAAAADDAQLFSALRAALASARADARTEPLADAWLARGADLQSVLRLVQQERQPSADELLSPRNAKQLRQLVMARLHALSPQQQTPVLAQEDEDTLDLIGLLFEHLVDGPIPPALHRALAGLQLPILRVALRDKKFFSQSSHVGRRLLTDVVQSSIEWLEEPDAELEARLRALTDRVAAAEDEAQIQPSLDEFREHVQRMARRAEAAERRHVDAVKGRLQLEQARQHAEQAVAKLLQRHDAGMRLRGMLESAWTDVLVLSALREGEGSTLFRRRLAVADWLLRNARRDGVALTEVIQQELRDGLAQVGQHREQTDAFLASLFLPDDVAPLPEEATDPAREHPRLGGMAARKAASSQVPLDKAGEKALAALPNIPFGTWFEFDGEAGQPPTRRKLAWLSTVSGTCLLVTRRGHPTDDMTMRELAHRLAKGTARQVRDGRESLIGRAWQVILSGLQQRRGE